MVDYASEYFEILIIEESFKYQILLKTLLLITSIKLKNQITLSDKQKNVSKRKVTQTTLYKRFNIKIQTSTKR